MKIRVCTVYMSDVFVDLPVSRYTDSCFLGVDIPHELLRKFGLMVQKTEEEHEDHLVVYGGGEYAYFLPMAGEELKFLIRDVFHFSEGEITLAEERELIGFLRTEFRPMKELEVLAEDLFIEIGDDPPGDAPPV